MKKYYKLTVRLENGFYTQKVKVFRNLSYARASVTLWSKNLAEKYNDEISYTLIEDLGDAN